MMVSSGSFYMVFSAATAFFRPESLPRKKKIGEKWPYLGPLPAEKPVVALKMAIESDDFRRFSPISTFEMGKSHLDSRDAIATASRRHRDAIATFAKTVEMAHLDA